MYTMGHLPKCHFLERLLGSSSLKGEVGRGMYIRYVILKYQNEYINFIFISNSDF
jgi:hypothetical protein